MVQKKIKLTKNAKVNICDEVHNTEISEKVKILLSKIAVINKPGFENTNILSL